MASNHLDDNQLLNAAYGVAAEEEERHLTECSECAESVARVASTLGLSHPLPAVERQEAPLDCRQRVGHPEPGTRSPAERDRASDRAEPLDLLPEAFWQRQRAAVLHAVSVPTPRPSFRPLLAFATALLVLMAIGVSLLVPRHAAPGRSPGASPYAVVHPAPIARVPLASMNDEQLFGAIFETVNRVEPQALEPVKLLLPAERPATRDPRAPAAPEVFTASAGDLGTVFVLEVTGRMPAAQPVARRN